MKLKVGNPVGANLDDFLVDCSLRGLKDATILSYKQKLEYFLNNYSFSQEGVNQFILDSKSKGSHTATINSYLRVLKVMNKYTNSCINIQFLKQEEIIKDIYTPEEIQKLIKRPTSNSFIEWRNWALECFIFGTGARISTALEITVEDLNLSSGTVLYRHSKNGRQQYFPLSKGLVNCLKIYINIRGDSGYLFCNIYGEKGSRDSINGQIAEYNRSRGVNKTSIHLMRHTWAANYVRNGGDPFRLQMLLGHSTLDMTRHYCNLYGSDLAYNIEEYSALDTNLRARIKVNK